MRYSQEATDIILSAAAQARAQGHSFVGSVHLLWAITLAPGECGLVLRQRGLSAQLVGDLGAVLYGVGSQSLPLPQGFSGEARRILSDAATEADLLGEKQVKTVHILLSLTRCDSAGAYGVLRAAGIDADDLFTELVGWHGREQTVWKGKREVSSMKLLEQFSEDLVQKASGMEPVIGREREIETVIGILSRKNKNNPALIGEPGVGKTAIAEGLAQRFLKLLNGIFLPTGFYIQKNYLFRNYRLLRQTVQ